VFSEAHTTAGDRLEGRWPNPISSSTTAWVRLIWLGPRVW